jgi:hypothetical protein
MVMRTQDGQEIQQTKETVSTITSFLDQNPKSPVNSAKPDSGSDEQALQQTNFLKSAFGTESRRPVGPAGSRPKF